MSEIQTIIQKIQTAATASQAPESEAVAQAAHTLEQAIKAWLPTVAADGVDILLGALPLDVGALLKPLIDPTVKAGVTMAEDAFWPYLDKLLAKV